MKQIKKNYSLEENLRDTQHNAKANQVFLKLLAKQKMGSNPFDKARTVTWNPTDKIKQGVDSSDAN